MLTLLVLTIALAASCSPLGTCLAGCRIGGSLDASQTEIINQDENQNPSQKLTESLDRGRAP